MGKLYLRIVLIVLYHISDVFAIDTFFKCSKWGKNRFMKTADCLTGNAENRGIKPIKYQGITALRTLDAHRRSYGHEKLLTSE